MVLGLGGFPGLNNSGDRLTISTANDDIIFSINYDDSWYDDPERSEGGFSLEMIDPSNVCGEDDNWTASDSPLGGTPGSLNSVNGSNPDTMNPTIVNAEFISPNSLRLDFSELLDIIALENLENYSIDNGLSFMQAAIDPLNPRFVDLTLSDSIEVGITYSISIGNIIDCVGNMVETNSITLTVGRSPGFNELLITEIMADPNPIQPGSILPESEYIEIFNPTNDFISLSNLSLMVNNAIQSLPGITVSANEYVTIVPQNFLSEFQSFTEAFPLEDFPSIPNAGATLSLTNGNDLIFSVSFSDTWYQDPARDEGGFSLEMRDVNNPCGQRENWGASLEQNGGTPSQINSINDTLPDNFGPQLIRAQANSITEVELFFNERLNPSDIFSDNFAINNGIVIDQAILSTPDLQSVMLTLSNTLEPGISYTATVQIATDCNGNLIQIESSSSSFGLTELFEMGDIIISEILFDPRLGANDFVEIFNNSNRFINLEGWRLANTDASQNDLELTLENLVVNDQTLLSETSLVLGPGQYFAFTRDADVLEEQYSISISVNRIIETDNLPSYPNTAGTVVLINSDNEIADFFQYTDDLHNPLLRNVDGISLERINFDSQINDPSAWTSASATSGFATPGSQNSQQTFTEPTSATIEVIPRVFVNDFRENNFTQILYNLSGSGVFGIVTIYDSNGREIRRLLDNQSLSLTGSIRWNGEDEEGQRVRPGYYVAIIELIQQDGKIEVFKERIAIARRF